MYDCVDTNISFEDPTLVQSKLREMIWPQTCRGSSFYVGWMRGTLEYNYSLSPTWTKCIKA